MNEIASQVICGAVSQLATSLGDLSFLRGYLFERLPFSVVTMLIWKSGIRETLVVKIEPTK